MFADHNRSHTAACRRGPCQGTMWQNTGHSNTKVIWTVFNYPFLKWLGKKKRKKEQWTTSQIQNAGVLCICACGLLHQSACQDLAWPSGKEKLGEWNTVRRIWDKRSRSLASSLYRKCLIMNFKGCHMYRLCQDSWKMVPGPGREWHFLSSMVILQVTFNAELPFLGIPIWSYHLLYLSSLVFFCFCIFWILTELEF